MNNNPMLKNAFTMTSIIVILGGAVALYFQLFGSAFIHSISELTAESSAFTLNLFGANVRTSGTIVASDRFAYNIVVECTAIGPLILYVGAVLAFPTHMRSKLIRRGPWRRVHRWAQRDSAGVAVLHRHVRAETA